jgi:hypothetical protein
MQRPPKLAMRQTDHALHNYLSSIQKLAGGIEGFDASAAKTHESGGAGHAGESAHHFVQDPVHIGSTLFASCLQYARLCVTLHKLSAAHDEIGGRCAEHCGRSAMADEGCGTAVPCFRLCTCGRVAVINSRVRSGSGQAE